MMHRIHAGDIGERPFRRIEVEPLPGEFPVEEPVPEEAPAAEPAREPEEVPA